MRKSLWDVAACAYVLWVRCFRVHAAISKGTCFDSSQWTCAAALPPAMTEKPPMIVITMLRVRSDVVVRIIVVVRSVLTKDLSSLASAL